MFFRIKNSDVTGVVVRKMRVVKIVGFLILVIIVSIQIFRIASFDLTAIPIIRTRK